MSEIRGPYFEVKITRDGAQYAYLFLPGNVAPKIYEYTKQSLFELEKETYGGNYIKKINVPSIGETPLIIDKKVLAVIKTILTTPAFKGFKVKLLGRDKDGNATTTILSTVEDCELAKGGIPYFCKRNNPLTSGRRK